MPPDSSDSHSPSFRRGGKSAVFTLEVLEGLGGGGVLDVRIEHRDGADSPWAPVGVFPSISGPGVVSLSCSGIREDWRFAYSVAGGGPGERVRFRPLPARWNP